MTNLYVEPLHPDSKLPYKQTSHAACYDVHAYVTPYDKDKPIQIKGYNNRNQYFELFQEYDDQSIIVSPGDRVLIPTGLAVCSDVGFKVQLLARSGIAFKRGLMLSNSVGTIDTDYRDELFVIYTNTTETTVKITHGERIAQIELIRLTTTTMMVGKLPSTDSNRSGGIGSTGQ